MTVGETRLYGERGRMAGCFVYAILCGTPQEMAVKIGHSVDPAGRLLQLRRSLIAPAKTLAVAEFISKKEAWRAEILLHHAFREHRIRGEWFKFSMADKEFFNRESARILSAFARPGWPLRWKKMPIEAFLADRGGRQQTGMPVGMILRRRPICPI